MRARGGRAMDERGSALVITLLLLVILTAIGIYAISLTSTEMNIAIQSKMGTAAFNSADAGANYAIDQIPTTVSATDNSGKGTLPDNSKYAVTSVATGKTSLRPGYRDNYRFLDFEVSSTGTPPPGFSGDRGVHVVVDFGPVPVSTMYD